MVIPRYGRLPEGQTVSVETVVLGGQPFAVRFAEHPSPSGATTIMIDCPPLFDRHGLYSAPDGHDYSDNALRFALFSLAALRFAATKMPRPCVVHANDWHTGLVPFYLRTRPELTELRANAACIFTIHNIAFQGIFDARWLAPLEIPSSEFRVDSLEFWGQINFMKAGITDADIVTTVSPTYAREIATHEAGSGLDGVIRSRGRDVSGILNGIDLAGWNPATDPAIAQQYDLEHLQGKMTCRKALQVELGLEQDAQALLVGVVSRLTTQKGLDLVLAALPEMLKSGAQLVLQGTGEPTLEAAFRLAQHAHPGQVHTRIGYDEAFAHRLMAGADAILLPSRWEPCGIIQLYGLRYGTLPIVHSVGGLADSVDAQVGFKFAPHGVEPFLDALRRAANVFRRDPGGWRVMMLNAMRRDHSWDQTADRYGQAYSRALDRRRDSLSR